MEYEAHLARQFQWVEHCRNQYEAQRWSNPALPPMHLIDFGEIDRRVSVFSKAASIETSPEKLRRLAIGLDKVREDVVVKIMPLIHQISAYQYDLNLRIPPNSRTDQQYEFMHGWRQFLKAVLESQRDREVLKLWQAGERFSPTQEEWSRYQERVRIFRNTVKACDRAQESIVMVKKQEGLLQDFVPPQRISIHVHDLTAATHQLDRILREQHAIRNIGCQYMGDAQSPEECAYFENIIDQRTQEMSEWLLRTRQQLNVWETQSRGSLNFVLKDLKKKIVRVEDAMLGYPNKIEPFYDL